MAIEEDEKEIEREVMQSKSALTAATEESNSSEVDMYVITVATKTFYTALAIDNRTEVIVTAAIRMIMNLNRRGRLQRLKPANRL
jgi:hypothetical protein